jgi:hypothetical protein
MILDGERTAAAAFETRLACLDLTLFAAIPSESTPRDRRSLLACQAAVRRRRSPYAYLEIGSHLGGSLQPHILDPACEAAHSIDPRPAVQADARGGRFAYPANSTNRMKENLARIGDVERLRCYEQPAARIDVASVLPRPHLCFIDGEHTDDAVLADFAFCRQAIAPPGLILFHDAHIVYNALSQIVESLERAGVPFEACALPDTIFALELGGMGLLASDELDVVRRDSYRGYLFSLLQTDPHRRFATRWPFRVYRRARALLGI